MSCNRLCQCQNQHCCALQEDGSSSPVLADFVADLVGGLGPTGLSGSLGLGPLQGAAGPPLAPAPALPYAQAGSASSHLFGTPYGGQAIFDWNMRLADQVAALGAACGTQEKPSTPLMLKLQRHWAQEVRCDPSHAPPSSWWLHT